MNKFTPGPWKILINAQELHNIKTGESTFLPRYSINSERRAICTTVPSASKADADLIAAALDMYEALEEIKYRLGPNALDLIGAVGVDILNNALKKARGEV
jgi:hypothetical protein